MITDNKTNKVFFSNWLKRNFKELYMMLSMVLDEYHVQHGLLNYTKDYWCRDYMPIQISEDEFIQYKYYPDYLLKYPDDNIYITNPSQSCKRLGVHTNKINIIIDGGNIIKCPDTIIMTEKIFAENPNYSKDDLVCILKNIFKSDILFLPWDKNEKYGHADGIVRYISNNNVLMTNYKDFDPKIATEIKHRLSAKYEVFELKYTSLITNRNSWAYINFLQTEQIIILPKFDIPEDKQAFDQMTEYFPEYKGRIIQVNANEIAREGGAFNCVSWNIRL